MNSELKQGNLSRWLTGYGSQGGAFCSFRNEIPRLSPFLH